MPFFRNWLHQNNLLLVGIFIGVALIVPTQFSPVDYFRQQAGRLLAVGITTVYWIYRQLLELAHSGPERYRHTWARLQVYRVLLSTGAEDVQRRHSNRSGRTKRQREPVIEEAREGATGHTGEHAWTGNEGLQGGHQEGGQQSMRVEGDYEEDCEEEHEVNFVNQTGTRYSSKPFSTNASALGEVATTAY